MQTLTAITAALVELSPWRAFDISYLVQCPQHPHEEGREWLVQGHTGSEWQCLSFTFVPSRPKFLSLNLWAISWFSNLPVLSNHLGSFKNLQMPGLHSSSTESQSQGRWGGHENFLKALQLIQMCSRFENHVGRIICSLPLQRAAAL